jgi:hypothetical protein
MEPVIKEKWVAALRSGDYKQGYARLKKQDAKGNLSYCCLGVLAEVAGFGFLETANRSGDFPLKAFEGVYAVLPKEHLKEAGLDSAAQDKLVDFNDGGRSFKWIAYYIDRYL